MGGDLHVRQGDERVLVVSIHAPVWGATSPLDLNETTLAFQSTPRMGGDFPTEHVRTPPLCFNPRPRMGGDLHRRKMRWLISRFNPRPRMGGDVDLPPIEIGGHQFQSTPPYGGRPLHRLRHHATQSFNPRPRMGGDPALLAAF